MKLWLRRGLLLLAVVLVLSDLAVWLYFYLTPPAPAWFGSLVGVAAALAVVLAALGGLPDLLAAPPEEPWDGQEKL